jgi:hypothetical protein
VVKKIKFGIGKPMWMAISIRALELGTTVSAAGRQLFGEWLDGKRTIDGSPKLPIGNRQTLFVRCEPDYHRALRIHAAQQEVCLSNVGRALFAAWLKEDRAP